MVQLVRRTDVTSSALLAPVERTAPPSGPSPTAWPDVLRTVQAVAELARIAGLFEVGGIPYLTFKGPTLALLAYGNVGARQFGDLDVLVRPEDIAKVTDLLAQRGYEHADRVEARLVPALRRSAGRLRLVHPERGLVADPHWRNLKPGLAPRLDLDALWTRAQTVTLGGRSIPTLGNEDLTLYLALHGYFHRWERIQWLEDLHRMIQLHPELDWKARARPVHRRRRFGRLPHRQVHPEGGRGPDDSPHRLPDARPRAASGPATGGCQGVRPVARRPRFRVAPRGAPPALLRGEAGKGRAGARREHGGYQGPKA